MAIALVQIERTSAESRFELRLSHANTTNGNQRRERDRPLQCPQLAVEWSLLCFKHSDRSIHIEHRALQRFGNASAAVGTATSLQRPEQSRQTTASDRNEGQNRQKNGEF